MFKVVFVKQIFNAKEPCPSAQFAVFRRDETLPFAPSPGHEFFWGHGQPQKLASVTFNVLDSTFSCRVEDAFADPFSIEGMDFDDLVEEAKQGGWVLVRVFGG